MRLKKVSTGSGRPETKFYILYTRQRTFAQKKRHYIEITAGRYTHTAYSRNKSQQKCEASSLSYENNPDIQFSKETLTKKNNETTILSFPGRRRRRRQMQMMPIIMMGVLLMGSVLIPMGFQFLAVLGGKALILAKMALMLSSIQGLKKIATNGVNYGLYHTPVPEAWHERSTGYHEIPYNYETVHTSTAGHTAGGYLDSLGTVFARRSAVQPT